MKSRTTPFVLAVMAAAFWVLSTLEAIGDHGAREQITAIAVLGALALMAEMLGFVLPKGANASISSMPGLAIVLVSPTWHSVVALAGVRAIVESIRRSDFEKAVFNISQYALSYGLAAHVFTSFGGVPFFELRSATLSDLTSANGLAAFAGLLTMFSTNAILVSTVVAIASRAPITSILRANNVAMIGMDIVGSPMIFLFAWAYVRFGPIAATALWIPIIGIRQVHKTNLELEQTNAELLDLMVKSIEARDVYTSGHSRRVQHYSTLIARAIGLSERDIDMIGKAALLHDVGKISEKYGPILRKADRLTPEEWDTMKEHPADGAALVATMTKLRELVGPVRHHHENWDGTGYPDGLTGELIPLAARVIRFADTVDAMTTERPYRRALTSDEVRLELIRCRGTQFDPRIVDRLLSSPQWSTMFAPVEAGQMATRFGGLAVVAGARPREAQGA
jgi:putative nucleotidyltransferase with HDIG domain